MVQNAVQKKAVIYARVSTDDQKCERQVQELTAFATRLGVEVVEIFTETASGSKDDRPVRKTVMSLVQQRKIDIILVLEMTRWGRSTEDLLSTLNTLAAKKVSLLAPTGIEFDMSTPQGKLMVTVLAAISDFERGLMLERVKSGIAHAKIKGTKTGRAFGRPKSEHEDVVKVHLKNGLPVREIAQRTGISKTTVMAIKKRSITG